MSASPIVCTSDLSEASRPGDPQHLASWSLAQMRRRVVLPPDDVAEGHSSPA
jgi:hypothetical protein